MKQILSNSSNVLANLPNRCTVTVDCVLEQRQGDPIARRLRDIGFVQGEQVHVVTRAPFGGDPLVVQVGFTRFALRRAEAERIMIHDGDYLAAA